MYIIYIYVNPTKSTKMMSPHYSSNVVFFNLQKRPNDQPGWSFPASWSSEATDSSPKIGDRGCHGEANISSH